MRVLVLTSEWTTSVFFLRLIGMLVNYAIMTFFFTITFPCHCHYSPVTHSYCDQSPSQPSATVYRPPMLTVTAHSGSSYQYYTSISAICFPAGHLAISSCNKNICVHCVVHVTCLPPTHISYCSCEQRNPWISFHQMNSLRIPYIIASTCVLRYLLTW